MVALNSNLWQAIGKPKWSLWTSVFGMPLYLIAFGVGAWGFDTIEAVAVGLDDRRHASRWSRRCTLQARPSSAARS